MGCSLGIPEQNAIARDLPARASKPDLTSLSRYGDRESSLVLQLANYRYLTGSQIERFLFDGTPITPGSRPVLTRRVLGRLKRQGLIQDRLDTRAGIDRDSEQRQVLRQRQRAVGAQMPP